MFSGSQKFCKYATRWRYTKTNKEPQLHKQRKANIKRKVTKKKKKKKKTIAK
ncbi:hypothetical protein QG37_05360 [Candidozyma auris]|uniref:Uncharacterized protein n=1 Tax=Candidozyma auris TaxID=498019 RepID=A0A0L0NUZ9_CANAR|nr:hypothetical protein QG37_05360 [[Candida] auris]